MTTGTLKIERIELHVGEGFSPEMCPFEHDNIQFLYHVTPTPVEDLPKVCTCGAPLTYHPDGVYFINVDTSEEDAG